MSQSSNADAIRRRVEGWRAAERRELEYRRTMPVLDAEASLLAAIEFCELLPPDARAEDSVRTREVEQARRTWAKLRAHFGCLPDQPNR